MMVYRGHMIAQSDERDPETGKLLYGISELKAATTPPLFVTQSACIAYIKQVEPWDQIRVNAYGQRRDQFRPPKKKDKRYDRNSYFLEARYGRYET